MSHSEYPRSVVVAVLLQVETSDGVCGVTVYFFFQAEDGIRDVAVTGVQTCALPIYRVLARVARLAAARALGGARAAGRRQRPRARERLTRSVVETARRALLLGRCVLDRKSVV